MIQREKSNKRKEEKYNLIIPSFYFKNNYSYDTLPELRKKEKCQRRQGKSKKEGIRARGTSQRYFGPGRQNGLALVPEDATKKIGKRGNETLTGKY